VGEPLRVLGEKTEPAQSWQQFLARRSALEAQMFLAVCDGCDHCGTRCIAGFGVTQQEWKDTVAFLAQQAPEERARIELQRRNLTWPGTEEHPIPVTYCRFRDLEKNCCSIYPVRPTICRLFGQTEWLPCPIDAVPAYPAGAASLWNDYRIEKRKTWEEWQEEEIAQAMSNG
jgi:Fe-S-cluster containining protein